LPVAPPVLAIAPELAEPLLLLGGALGPGAERSLASILPGAGSEAERVALGHEPQDEQTVR
jgi:hypothetical protein